MDTTTLQTNHLESSSLNSAEEILIDKKVNFELNEMQFKMIKVGGITNIISGLFVSWILFHHSNPTLLLSWYIVLVAINLINIGFSFYFVFCKVNAEKMGPWLFAYHFILALLCLAWGSLGVLFVSIDLHYQFYIVAFLLAVLVGFSFGTISDFVASVISILCLSLPFITIHTYLGIQSIRQTGEDPSLHLGFATCFAILGLFMLVTSYIGYRLIKRSFKLSFINAALSQKLENMNKFLEQRVKERTIELENSLNRVTYQATHDLLTDLPNQRLLVKHLQAIIKSYQKKKNNFCVIFLTLNEIERINDALGHNAGDLVIKSVAARLKSTFSNPIVIHDKKFRYFISLSRKDVFVIIIESIILDQLEFHIESIFSVLHDTVDIGKQPIKVTASLGITIYPEDGKSIKSLLMNADVAMLKAKLRGGNSYNLYHSELNADVTKQLEMETRLHSAMSQHEFTLQYQPFINLDTGEIAGAEALVRWNHPTLGLVSPANFIPLAEANGIIIPLGEWVLRTACEQTKKWHDQGFNKLKIAVNLSAKQLHQNNIISIIADIIETSKLDPKFLELELTETAAFQNSVIPILNKFNEMGLSLSIDDFGTGYSGLTNLKLFTIDKLKIDKSFVKDVDTSTDSQAIVANTIALAKKIKINVIAEGVETRSQLNFLRDNYCDLIQGYYFSPPISAEDFEEMLIKRKNFKDLL